MNRVLLALLGTILWIGANAECEVNLSVVIAEQPESVPEETQQFLLSRLQSIALSDGIIADESLERFFMTAKFNHILEDLLPGPPTQHVLNTQVTLYIGDVNSQTIFSSASISLRGIGNSPQRAFINALKGLTDVNPNIKNFVSKGKQKIIRYYDSNYKQIIEKADIASASHDYSKALWILSSIPECCIGYGEAKPKLLVAFKAYIDQEGLRLLNQAKACWSVSHNQIGGHEALQYLVQIDPESVAYPTAQSLYSEISKSVKSDRNFELRQKYTDSIELEKSKINAAKEIGVAYGRGQQPVTTNLMWLK